MAVRKRRKKRRAKAKAKTTRRKTTRRRKTARRKTTRRKTTRKRKTTRRRKATKKTTRRKTRRKTKRKTGKRKASGLMKMTYTLSAPLAAVCGTKSCNRPQVVKKVWAYIKKHKLQDAKNRRMINPDKKLGAVLGNRPINMLKMAGALSKHLK